MKRISTKMKLLTLAILGLGGMALAGSASAACPTTPDAWSATNAFGGGSVNVVSGGLDGSSCAMTASINSSPAAIATVIDNSPSDEPRYRAQFLIDPSALGTFGLADGVPIFTANATASYPSTGGRRAMLTISLSEGGGGAIRATIITSCENAATQNRCITNTPVMTAGVNRLEVDLQTGASGSLKYWLNAAAGSSEPTPTGSINFDNAGWVGVSQVSMGLSGATPSFRSNHAGQIVKFDTFDSRRQTYIGH